MSVTLGSEVNSMDGFIVKHPFLIGQIRDILQNCDNRQAFFLPVADLEKPRFVAINMVMVKSWPIKPDQMTRKRL